MLRAIFGYNKEEVKRSWRHLYSEKLHNFYSLRYTVGPIIRIVKLTKLRWEGLVAFIGEIRNIFTNLARNTGGKRPLGGPRRCC
jgi:hypothetical protein